jgi:Uma2 family endonuclease
MVSLAALDLGSMAPVTFSAPGLTEREFLALVDEAPDYFFEYTADGTVIVMPPTDPETGKRVHLVAYRLELWSGKDGTGSVLGADSGFFLPDGSRRSPDAAWFNEARWQAAQRPDTRFPVFAPEFVIEVRSPGQRARDLREKMEEYIANGVQLGWLIDPIEKTVAIYRPGRSPEVLVNPARVAGEGPVAGFVLELDRVL